MIFGESLKGLWLTKLIARGYFHLIQKDSITHMHGPEVYVKGKLTFAQDQFVQNSVDSYLCF